MKISELALKYAMQPRLKARLLKEVTLHDGTVFEIGQESDLLIDCGDGTYHFESDDSACTVKKNEIEFISRTKKVELEPVVEPIKKSRFNI